MRQHECSSQNKRAYYCLIIPAFFKCGDFFEAFGHTLLNSSSVFEGVPPAAIKLNA